MSGGFVSRKSPGPYLTGRNGQRAPVTTPARARLLIADDHKLFAEVLRIALQRAGWSDVTVTTTLQETLELLRVRRPHLVLMDTGLLNQDGDGLAQQVLSECQGCRCVALVSVPPERSTEDLAAGAFDAYASKDTSITHFIKILTAVLNDDAGVDRRVRERRLTDSQPWGEEFLIQQLTRREREVLSLLCRGISGHDLADRLHISNNTVRAHVHNILSKLQVHSRLEAVAFAARNGLARRRWAESA
jgi:two-component system nitrate/nitrite response regulator NarL